MTATKQVSAAGVANTCRSCSFYFTKSTLENVSLKDFSVT